MRREVISRSRNYVTGTITVTVLESDDRGTRWRVKGAETPWRKTQKAALSDA